MLFCKNIPRLPHIAAVCLRSLQIVQRCVVLILSFETLVAVAGRLPVLRIKVQIKMHSSGVFADNASALFHGALGWAMHDVAPTLWQLGYGELAQQDSRPFSVLPPSPTKWQADDLLWFDFTAAAGMALHIEPLLQSLLHMGERGLGEAGTDDQRRGFTVQQVLQITPYGSCLLWHHQLPQVRGALRPCLAEAIGQAIALGQSAPEASLALRVECISRLRLKVQGQVLRQAPSAKVLASAVARRLLNLQNASEQETQQIYQLLTPLADIQLVADHTQSDGLNRYSRKLQQRHVIEGISGHWLYASPEVRLLLPWLALAQWLQVGGKTSFGFGAIEWQLVVLGE